jgi:hypothetical protein
MNAVIPTLACRRLQICGSQIIEIVRGIIIPFSGEKNQIDGQLGTALRAISLDVQGVEGK